MLYASCQFGSGLNVVNKQSSASSSQDHDRSVIDDPPLEDRTQPHRQHNFLLNRFVRVHTLQVRPSNGTSAPAQESTRPQT